MIANQPCLCIVHLPREPQEVHPWYQDGLRWSQEGQGAQRPGYVSSPSHHDSPEAPLLTRFPLQLPQGVHRLNDPDVLLFPSHGLFVLFSVTPSHGISIDVGGLVWRRGLISRNPEGTGPCNIIPDYSNG